MGLCASSKAQPPNGGAEETRNKYVLGEESKTISQFSGVRRTESAFNVTERKIETALAAARKKKKARFVVTDHSGSNANGNFKCPKIPKSADQTEFLMAALTENFFMFRDLEEQNQVDMVGAMSEMTIKKGEEIMKQGDNGDKMYVISSGSFDILVDGQKVSTAEKSKVIGELALVYQVRRPLTMH